MGGILIAALLAAGAVLNACAGDQPVGPARSAPDRPSLALNPECAGSGGQTHVDSVRTDVTWDSTGNPHRVDQLIHIEGSGILRLAPGTLVCFGSGGGLRADNGGRLRVEASHPAPVVLTAADLAGGWLGVRLDGNPAGNSSIKHLRLEHTRGTFAFATHDRHSAAIDSSVFRQNVNGVYLWGRSGSLRRSRVDTVTSAAWPAVTLGRKTTFQQTAIRGAAGVGLAVLGTDSMSVSGGRILGSGGVGLWVTTPAAGFLNAQGVRVTAGASYPAEMDVGAFARLYPGTQAQDSLLGNARDTLVVTGGTLPSEVYARQVLPWKVTADVGVLGHLMARPGATLFFNENVGLTARDGGRVSARGTAAAPVRFTGVNTQYGWYGLRFTGSPPVPSYLTNVLVEYARITPAVWAFDNHTVIIDSAVFRQNGAAAFLFSANSRISRTRVDTTLLSNPNPAVHLFHSTLLESTLIRAPAGDGVRLSGFGAQILSCEVRDGAANGIDLSSGGEVHNCNLVNNAGAGIITTSVVDHNVEDNWWGDAAGPDGPNGDGVSATLDYTPWLTTPYVLPYVP